MSSPRAASRPAAAVAQPIEDDRRTLAGTTDGRRDRARRRRPRGDARRGGDAKPQPKPYELAIGCVFFAVLAFGGVWLYGYLMGAETDPAGAGGPNQTPASLPAIPIYTSIAHLPDGDAVLALDRRDPDRRTVGYALVRHPLDRGPARTLVKFEGHARYLTLSPDGRTAAVSARESVRLFDIDIGSGGARERWRLPKDVAHAVPAPLVAFSPDGRQIAVPRFPGHDGNGVVRVVDARTGTVTQTLRVGDGGQLHADVAAFAPGGEAVAAAGTDTEGGWRTQLATTDVGRAVAARARRTGVGAEGRLARPPDAAVGAGVLSRRRARGDRRCHADPHARRRRRRGGPHARSRRDLRGDRPAPSATRRLFG